MDEVTPLEEIGRVLGAAQRILGTFTIEVDYGRNGSEEARVRVPGGQVFYGWTLVEALRAAMAAKARS